MTQDIFDMPSCYHSGLSRNRTEEMLVQAEKNGAYIVRSSESIQGAYVLSEFYNHKVHHYRIIPSDKGYFIECPGTSSNRHFPDLKQLVEFYSKPKRGLVTELTYPVEFEDDEDEEDMFHNNIQSVYYPFLNYLSQMEIQKSDPEFSKLISEYFIKSYTKEICKIKDGTCFNSEKILSLLYPDIQALASSLSNLCLKIDVINKVLQLDYFSKENDIPTIESDLNFSHFQTYLTHVQDFLLHRKNSINTSFISYANNLGLDDESYKIIKNAPNFNTKININDRSLDSFEVFLGAKAVKAIVQTDILSGKITILKPSSSIELACTAIIQLIKVTNKPNTISVVVKSNECYTLYFFKLQTMENFCQSIRAMMDHHNVNKSKDRISIFIGTWNMGESPPPDNLNSWFLGKGTGFYIKNEYNNIHDIYVIGVQENDTLMGLQNKEWPLKLKSIISNSSRKEFRIVAFEHFWHIGLVVLVKSELFNKITNVTQSNVKTGLGKINVGSKFGNKGAVGVSFSFEKTKLLFINSHLTSGHETKRLIKRRANFSDIVKNLLSNRELDSCDVTNQFHHVFFCGDLNYRINLDSEIILEKVKEGDYQSLIQSDQLTYEIDSRNAFYGFLEAPIHFPPTYRYKRGDRTQYHILKKKTVRDRINVPSYCDRILWKSYPNSPIIATSYGCSDDIFSSDHSPVYSSFIIGIQNQYVSKSKYTNAESITDYVIKIEYIEASITRSIQNETYQIQIISPCIEGKVKSKICSSVLDQEDDISLVIIQWNSNDFLHLIEPIIGEPEYLKEQIMIIQILLGPGDEEVYGEYLFSLANCINIESNAFSGELTYNAHPVGKIKGKISIYNRSFGNETFVGTMNDDEAYAKFNIVMHSSIDELQLPTSTPIIGNSTKFSRIISDAHPEKYYIGNQIFNINESIESLQTTQSSVFLEKYNLGKYSAHLSKSGFEYAVQLYYLNESYLQNLNISGSDAKKLLSISKYIAQYFQPK